MTPPGARAVIDIGSNSVRLVIYAGPARAPLATFNEKVMAGLGREVGATGRMGEEPRARALAAIARFVALTDSAGVDRPRIVATAAVRDARDGPLFAEAVRALGHGLQVLSGADEARMAALGVIAGLPDADGIVADLGGGSLELVRVADGQAGAGVSLPLGVLRMGALATDKRRKLAAAVGQGLATADWPRGEGRQTLYLVGGSFRSLAALDLAWRGRTAPALHGLTIAPERAAELRRRLGRMSAEALAALPGVSANRRPQMPAAAAMLDALVQQLKPSALVVSATGLREGVLFDALTPEERAADPLIEAVRFEAALASPGQRHGPEFGAAIDRWIAPLFDDPPALARLRLAAAHLASTGWRANPSFRAERAAETAFHGNWIGVDAGGRAIMAAALDACFGGGSGLESQLTDWCDAPALARAREWGLAMRLAQRFSGGAVAMLGEARLVWAGERLELRLTGDVPAGEVVERRLRQLAGAFGAEGVVVESPLTPTFRRSRKL